MMSLTSSQKYDSIVNYPEEGKRDDGNCSTAATSKKKLGLCVISFGILFIAFNKLGQFSGARTEPDVLAEKQSKYRNIARTGTASTSIKKSPSKPELAIDGKENTGFKWKKGSWKVSFPDMSYMHNIKLSFGGHGKKTCNDMVLDVLDVSDQVVFTTGSNIHCTGRLGGEANVYVGMKGHSVRVTNKKRIEMNLKDVQVFDDVVNNVSYGDKVSLQVNSMDHQWLSGGRGSNAGTNWGVVSRNFLGNEYEQKAMHSYNWDVRSSLGKPINYPVDEQVGKCVKFGDAVYLRKGIHFWLSGGINSLNKRAPDENVFTRDPFGKANFPSYKWTVRSSAGEASLSFVDEHKGSCVKYDNIIYLQLNPPGVGGFLSGGHDSNHAPYEGVRTQDPTGNLSSNFISSYQWIIRRTPGDGTRDNTRTV